MNVYVVTGYKKGFTRKSGWDMKSIRTFRTERKAKMAKEADYDGYDDITIETVRLEQKISC